MTEDVEVEAATEGADEFCFSQSRCVSSREIDDVFLIKSYNTYESILHAFSNISPRNKVKMGHFCKIPEEKYFFFSFLSLNCSFRSTQNFAFVEEKEFFYLSFIELVCPC